MIAIFHKLLEGPFCYRPLCKAFQQAQDQRVPALDELHQTQVLAVVLSHQQHVSTNSNKVAESSISPQSVHNGSSEQKKDQADRKP